MGNSFGGLATIELCEKYPEYVAGALALCPALTYAPNAVLNLDKMAEVPIWFAHATNDKTIPVTASQNAVNSLAGVEVLFTEYSDDNMEAVGADIDPNSTYSFHHVELAVFNDDSYMTWLFEKHK